MDRGATKGSLKKREDSEVAASVNDAVETVSQAASSLVESVSAAALKLAKATRK